MSELPIDSVAIGKRIRSLREKLNKTQSYFADIMYISPSYLALIEAGKRIPNIEVFAQIATEFDVTLDYLIFGEDKQMDSVQKNFDRLRSRYSEEEIKKALRLAEYFLLLNSTEVK